MRRLFLALCALALGIAPVLAQSDRQQPDLAYVFPNSNPAWPAGAGPRIVLSTTESNYVRRGSMDPFARLAEGDGFTVERQQGDLAAALAQGPAILVIANPYLESFADQPAMTPPSAFSPAEIEAVRAWVQGGGSLLLLADHAPFGGGSSELAAAFGFTFLNGHAIEDRAAAAGYNKVSIEFTPGRGLATDHPITDGSTGRAKIARFQAFGGQAFIPAEGAQTLLTIPQGWSAVFTYRLSAERQTAPRIDASGMAQGAAMEFGQGRIAVFTEAGAFTAQVIDGVDRFGFNTAEGRDNPEFILATLRWLARQPR